MSKYYLGNFQLLVMLAIQKLGGNKAYSASIIELLYIKTKKLHASGAIGETLNRLGEAGWISRRLTNNTQGGGRKKMLYCLTKEGKKMLKKTLKAIDTLRHN